VQLSPDGAFGLGPLARPCASKVDTFCLIRDDAETAGGDMSALKSLSSSLVNDWLAEPPHFGFQMRLSSTLHSVVSGRWTRAERQQFACHRLATHRVQRGLAMLAQGQCVLTDRLHAHILSVLMGLPNVVLDNNYGKIHGYMQAWTQGAYRTHMASSVPEAVELLRAVSQQGREGRSGLDTSVPIQVTGR
jgi:exopolysaccharide biosynthesis predicted pyruvyltransferase EpsI